MNIFFIGSTSRFAKMVISNLEKNNTVYKFGRSNLDYKNYDQMKEEFSKYPDPDIVIFNIRCSSTTVDYNRSLVDSELSEISKNFYSSFFTKLHIFDICKKASDFVFITSSITKWTHDPKLGLNHIMYRQLRASEQQIMKSIASEGKLSYGLCPGGMDEDPEGHEGYAKNLANIILEQDNKLNGTVSLVNQYYE